MDNNNINCLIVDDEIIARDVLENLLLKIDKVNIVGKCKNAIEAFNLISQECIHLIFLDINMPQISGLSFAKSINKDIKIIFTTAYREFAVDGFDLQAVDYLLKPISYERLLQAINKYLDENIKKQTNIEPPDQSIKDDYFFVRADRKMYKINYDEIDYIESIGDYLTIHFHNKKITTRETISNIEAKLKKDNFLRIHRSFIVPLRKIESFTNETIEIGKKELPIGRSYKDDVISRLKK